MRSFMSLLLRVNRRTLPVYLLPVLTLVLLLLAAAPGHAQSASLMGTIDGVVTDQNSRVVAGASCVIRNDATSESRTVVTDTAGRFAVAGIQAGNYTIEASAQNLRKERQAVKVGPGQTQTLTFKLNLGQVSEEVSVSVKDAGAGAPSQPYLSARSAQSVVSEDFIRSTAPAADYSQVLQA